MTKNKTASVVLMAALAVCVSVLSAGAQSLADVARKEAARRESVKAPAKVVTNNDLRAVASAAPAVPPDAAGDPVVQPPTAAGDAPAEKLPEAPDPTKSQEYWRKRITDARQARDHNAFLLEAIQSRINALTADFSARDDPFQRAQIQTNRQNAIAELDRMTKAQVDLERQISDIEEEARRANVPPGWLR